MTPAERAAARELIGRIERRGVDRPDVRKLLVDSAKALDALDEADAREAAAYEQGQHDVYRELAAVVEAVRPAPRPDEGAGT